MGILRPVVVLVEEHGTELMGIVGAWNQHVGDRYKH